MKNKIKFDNLNNIKKLGVFKILQILSIDVVLGTLCSGFMVTKIVNIMPDLWWWIVLPISVWLIYTVDHLSDGLKLGYNAKSIRYFFHFYYKKWLIVFIVLVGILASVITFFWLDYRIVYFGLVVGVLVLIYLIMNVLLNNFSFKLFPKEIIIALLYTAGIWGGPLALVNYSVSFSIYFLIILFFSIALSNLFLFSLFEMDNDKINNQKSIALFLGKKKLTKIIKTIGLLTITVGILFIIFASYDIEILISTIILIVMQLFLLMVIYKKDYFKNNELYRVVGDAVFFLPLLIVLV